VTTDSIADEWVSVSVSPQTLTSGASYVVSTGWPSKFNVVVNVAADMTFSTAITFDGGRWNGNYLNYPSFSNATNAYGIADIVFTT